MRVRSNVRRRAAPRRRIAPLLALTTALTPAPLLAQNDGARAEAAAPADHAAMPGITAARITDPIALDGRLDEAVWLSAEPATAFIQTEPDEGRPATERTIVHIVYDDDAIYVGARLFDSTGDVRKRLGRRDSHLDDSDWFYVMFDSYHDHVAAYQFSVNPAGVKRDEIVMGGTSWDAVWDVATSVDPEGWTAELRIPFS